MTITIKGLMGEKRNLNIVGHDVQGSDDVSIVDAQCVTCTNIYRFTIGEKELAAWIDGAHIQNAIPYLSPDERELFISGLCGPCFDRLMS
jgi:hypothetical protein